MFTRKEKSATNFEAAFDAPTLTFPPSLVAVASGGSELLASGIAVVPDALCVLALCVLEASAVATFVVYAMFVSTGNLVAKLWRVLRQQDLLLPKVFSP